MNLQVVKGIIRLKSLLQLVDLPVYFRLLMLLETKKDKLKITKSVAEK